MSDLPTENAMELPRQLEEVRKDRDTIRRVSRELAYSLDMYREGGMKKEGVQKAEYEWRKVLEENIP